MNATDKNDPVYKFLSSPFVMCLACGFNLGLLVAFIIFAMGVL